MSTIQLGRLLNCITQPLRMVRGSRACLHNPVLGVTQDSRRVKPGWIFVACPGATKHSHHGHAFVQQACEQQVVAVVVSDAACVMGDANQVVNNSSDTTAKHNKIPVFVVANPRLALAQLAEAWHGYPSKQMQVCAVTGTNGKTSVTHLLATVLQRAGQRVAVLGTLGVGQTGHLQATGHTTSTAEDLSAQLALLHEQGCSHVCMEMSSHALALERAHGITLALGALTNITQDHLDFHGSMQQYTQAKQQLFCELLAAGQPAVLPLGHPFVQQAQQRGLRVVTWGHENQADVWASDMNCSLHGTALMLHVNHRVFDVKCALWGNLHVDNMLCAAACAWALGVGEDVLAQGLSQTQSLPGRMQIVRVQGNCAVEAPTVLVDYAHTPHALGCVLDAALQVLPKKGRLIVVFGCGGQRDAGKRPVMSEIAAQKAHLTLLAHDNPRHEDPMAILQHIAQGMAKYPHCQYRMVGDRAQAIEQAIEVAGPQDIVVIAGKGHEQTQQWGDENKPFCDVAHARQALQNRFSS